MPRLGLRARRADAPPDAPAGGAALERPIARLATRTPGERLVDVAPGAPVDAADAQLALVHAAPPDFATDVDEQPYRCCARLL